MYAIRSYYVEAFKAVYARAYELGCKGCTTYRPSPLRKPILSTEGSGSEEPPCAAPAPRPQALSGTTYKLKWPLTDENRITSYNVCYTKLLRATSLYQCEVSWFDRFRSTLSRSTL